MQVSTLVLIPSMQGGVSRAATGLVPAKTIYPDDSGDGNRLTVTALHANQIPKKATAGAGNSADGRRPL